MRVRYSLVPLFLASGLITVLLHLLSPYSIETPVAHAANHNVCPAGPPDCEFSTIQAAVDAASDNDIIKVAAGTYTDMHVRARNDITTTGVVTQVVYITKSVIIRGGYTTTNSFADPPNPVVNVTTLDAQQQGRVLYIAGNITPTIEGLRLIGGDANGLGGWGYDVGGGVYIITAAVNLRNNWVISCAAYHGGGVFLADSAAVLSGNTIASNTVSSHYTHHGGGLYLHSSSATLSDNTISGNIAGTGGGVFLNNSDATLVENSIVANYAGENGGGVFVFGSPAMLSKNSIRENISWSNGGGLALNWSDAVLSHNFISQNRAANRGGGGLYLGIGAPLLEYNVVISNTTDGYGGGMQLYQSDALLIGNIVALNSNDTFPFNYGSGLYIYTINPTIYLVHTTVSRNSGGDGSGIYVTGGAPVTLINTILVSHTVGIHTEGNTVTMEATLWGAGAWANETDWNGNGTVHTGTISVWGAPGFADPGSGDFHICSTSAAKDNGLNAGVIEDIDSDSRPQGGGYDIGADEYTLMAVDALRLTNALTDSNSLTATLRWGARSDAVTYTLHYSNGLITGDNWTSATTLADALPGDASEYIAVVPSTNDRVYFALKRWNTCGEETLVSNNAFWPSLSAYLPIIERGY